MALCSSIRIFLSKRCPCKGKDFTEFSNDFDLNNPPQGVNLEIFLNDFKNVLSPFNLAADQSATAAAPDGALFDPRQEAVHSYLDGFDIAAIPELPEQIAPEELEGVFSVGFTRMNSATDYLQNRFANIRFARENAFLGEDGRAQATSSAKEAIVFE